MLFNSWSFLSLLLITVSLYYAPFSGSTRRIWQVTLLLTASAVFYAWNEPRLLILLFSSCLVNAIAVERIIFWKSQHSPGDREKTKDLKRARRWLVTTVALNLAFLAFFKYSGFISDFMPEHMLPSNVKAWLSAIPLPIGISFYTFQGISLVVDVWRDDISDTTRSKLAAKGNRRLSSIRDTSFYISFFPQLVAGPIVKAHEFLDQISGKQFFTIDWLTVRRCLIVGYFLKIFVADNLSEQTAMLTLGSDALLNNSPLNLMALLYGYSFQIFADFAGYSLIAIGLGALFGYKLPSNFNFPYLSTSITEFWRRWHLSLSSWLRDYLYIPLGGNRKGSGRTYFNLFLVMFLGGLWHGAAWKFAIWGSLHGIFLAIERFSDRRKKRHESSKAHQQFQIPVTPKSKSILSIGKNIIYFGITFHIVTFLWLTFMMPDLASIFAFFRAVSSGNLDFSGPPIFSLLFYGSAVALYHGWGWLKEHHKNIAEYFLRLHFEPVLHGAMIFLTLTNPGAPRGFIYFQF